jgi:hypothetical protein
MTHSWLFLLAGSVGIVVIIGSKKFLHYPDFVGGGLRFVRSVGKGEGLVRWLREGGWKHKHEPSTPHVLKTKTISSP